MSLILFCTSSSVTSMTVQCSSERGRGRRPASVTQGWSCKDIIDSFTNEIGKHDTAQLNNTLKRCLKRNLKSVEVKLQEQNC